MKAGRELDALVAEHVIGADGMWFRCPRCEGTWFGSSEAGDGTITRHCHDQFGNGCRWSGPRLSAPPRYSTDIASAWEVVAKVQRDQPGWRFVLLGGDSRMGRWSGKPWKAEFFGHADPNQDYGQRHGEAYADTAQLAICLAALRATTPDSEAPTGPTESDE
jgi:hypothetical protein